MTTSPPLSPGPRTERAPRRLGLAVTALLAVTAAGCLTASAVHFGLAPALEAPLLPAAIVEGSIGIGLVVALAAALTGRPWARLAAIAAFAYGVAGFILGVSIVARNPDLQTPFNVGVHAAILPLLALGLVVALRQSAMEAGRSRA